MIVLYLAANLLAARSFQKHLIILYVQDFIIDSVFYFTFSNLYPTSFVDTATDITSMPQYRQRLLNENGNNQAAGVNLIFQSYGF